ncbi:MAG: hypothetical protein OEV44_09515 [Spirochaetota bacterium]|nr:hypothetical protein [Spirochaetota bacterium]
MKRNKIDYKIKKSNYTIIKKTKSIKDARTNKYSGIYIIIVAFFALTVLSVYLLQDIKKLKKNMPSHKTALPKNIPEILYYLLINETSEKELGSVVMFTLHRDSKILILSYLPSEVTFDKKHSLSYYYKSKGANELLKQFKTIFDASFYYITLSTNFYEKTSSILKNVIVHLENKKELTIPYSMLDKKDNKSLYYISGNNLINYLDLEKKTSNLSLIQTKGTRLLYTIMAYLSSEKEILNILNNKMLISKHILGSNIPQKLLESLIKVIAKIKLTNVYSYPFSFTKKASDIYLDSSYKQYFQFIQFIKTRYEQKNNFSPGHYLQIIKSLGSISTGKKIRLKVIDQSGRGYQYSSPSFNSFFNILNLDVLVYNEEKDILNNSYIVNSIHNLEILNYVKGALKINLVYESAARSNPFFDLILVIGKDFPKIFSEKL